jgi:photosystem II stability/assembly factor-like uncharacterized protein
VRPSAVDRWQCAQSAPAGHPQSVQLAVLPGSLIVGVFGDHGHTGSFRLLHSNDRGSRWQTRPVSLHGQSCNGNTALIARPPATAFLLCNADGAGGSSDKRLLRTTDGGQTWRTLSGETLTGPAHPGRLPRAEPAALAAGSPNRLWLSGYNDLTVSNDGGRRWSQVRGLNPQGSPTIFDVLDGSHAWLVGLGSGLMSAAPGM